MSSYRVEAEEVEGDVLQVVVTEVDDDGDDVIGPDWGPTVHQFPLEALSEVVSTLSEHLSEAPDVDEPVQLPRVVLHEDTASAAMAVAVAEAKLAVTQEWLTAERDRCQQLLDQLAGA